MYRYVYQFTLVLQCICIYSCVCVNMYFDVFCIRYIMYFDVEVACAINLEKASPFPEFIARAGRPGSGLLSGTEPQRHSTKRIGC